MSLQMIVATGLNFEIGIDDKLLWYLPEDLIYFKEQTENKTVIMGHKTFESLPFSNGLPNRFNYVVNSSVYDSSNNCFFCQISDVVALINHNKNLKRQKDVWIIGGSSIYNQLIDYVDEIHWTRVEKVYSEANKFLSDKTIDVMIKAFDKGTRIKQCYDEKSDTHFTINVLKRVKQSS